MNIGLLIVGDEILSGKRDDKHLPKVIELLAARGLQLAWARYVGDDPRAHHRRPARRVRQRRRRVLAAAASARRPTTTRASAPRRALGVPLELHPQARDLILERMRDVARRAGPALRAGPRRTTCTGSTWACSRRAPQIIPNPYNKIAGFARARATAVHLRARLSGDGLADDRVGARHPLRHLHGARRDRERSVIVFGAMEATLTPLMEAIESALPGVKVFSLPSVDHPQHGRHIELGVKGDAALLDRGLRRAARRSRLRRVQSSAPSWCAETGCPCATAAVRARLHRQRRASCPRGAARGHAFCYIPVRVFGAPTPALARFANPHIPTQSPS